MAEYGNSHDFWIPGHQLDHAYPAATQEELEAELARVTRRETIPVGDVLGTIRMPDAGETIHGVASIDLCEILRETARSMVRTSGNHEYASNAYADGFWDGFTDRDVEYQSSVIQSIVQVMMDTRHVTATDGHQEMAMIMRQWRQQGVFVVANTSTLPGCEVATLRFLEEYYGDCFDGIVFPRNHDGRGKITKAAALGMALSELDTHQQNPRFALHIDDTAHHVETMITAPPHPNMRLFMPRFESNASLEGHPQVSHADAPIEVFADADMYIGEQLEHVNVAAATADRTRRLVNAALIRSLWIAR